MTGTLAEVLIEVETRGENRDFDQMDSGDYKTDIKAATDDAENAADWIVVQRQHTDNDILTGVITTYAFYAPQAGA